MSYSPFAVLGTMMMIKKNQNKLKQPIFEKEDKEEKIDYTEMLRKTYFPHLVEKSIDK